MCTIIMTDVPVLQFYNCLVGIKHYGFGKGSIQLQKSVNTVYVELLASRIFGDSL